MIGGPWSRLVEALDYDAADSAIVAVLELTECGETAEDIRRFLVREHSEWWAGE